MKIIPASMRNSRKPRNLQSLDSKADVWYYINPNGLDVCVSTKKGTAATISFNITCQQLERALEIIHQEDKR